MFVSLVVCVLQIFLLISLFPFLILIFIPFVSLFVHTYIKYIFFMYSAAAAAAVFVEILWNIVLFLWLLQYYVDIIWCVFVCLCMFFFWWDYKNKSKTWKILVVKYPSDASTSLFLSLSHFLILSFSLLNADRLHLPILYSSLLR